MSFAIAFFALTFCFLAQVIIFNLLTLEGCIILDNTKSLNYLGLWVSVIAFPILKRPMKTGPCTSLIIIFRVHVEASLGWYAWCSRTALLMPFCSLFSLKSCSVLDTLFSFWLCYVSRILITSAKSFFNYPDQWPNTSDTQSSAAKHQIQCFLKKPLVVSFHVLFGWVEWGRRYKKSDSFLVQDLHMNLFYFLSA